jgi:hypothetical protein
MKNMILGIAIAVIYLNVTQPNGLSGVRSYEGMTIETIGAMLESQGMAYRVATDQEISEANKPRVFVPSPPPIVDEEKKAEYEKAISDSKDKAKPTDVRIDALIKVLGI